MQRTPHSFIKNVKERKNVAFFWKERMPNPVISLNKQQAPCILSGCESGSWFDRDYISTMAVSQAPGLIKIVSQLALSSASEFIKMVSHMSLILVWRTLFLKYGSWLSHAQGSVSDLMTVIQASGLKNTVSDLWLMALFLIYEYDSRFCFWSIAPVSVCYLCSKALFLIYYSKFCFWSMAQGSVYYL